MFIYQIMDTFDYKIIIKPFKILKETYKTYISIYNQRYSKNEFDKLTTHQCMFTNQVCFLTTNKDKVNNYVLQLKNYYIKQLENEQNIISAYLQNINNDPLFKNKIKE